MKCTLLHPVEYDDAASHRATGRRGTIAPRMALLAGVGVAGAAPSSLMRPNTLIITRFGARGARLWVGARLLAGAEIALAGGDPLYLNASSVLLIVATCTALGMADMHRRHERALLENLGVSRIARRAFFAIPALVGESAIALVGSIVG